MFLQENVIVECKDIVLIKIWLYIITDKSSSNRGGSSCNGLRGYISNGDINCVNCSKNKVSANKLLYSATD